MELRPYRIMSSCVCFFVILSSFSISSSAHSEQLSRREEQLKQITKYDIIVPERLEGRYRRNADTLQETGHINEPSFILPIEGEEYILDLYLNDILFADGYLERTYWTQHIPTDSLPHRTHHCYYHGTVRGVNSSQVALSTCNGLSGYVSLEGSTFYLEPLDGSSAEHVIYRPEDMIREKPLYTMEENYPPEFQSEGEQRLRKIEEVHHDRVRRNNVNDETKYIEIIMVADSQMVRKRGGVAAVQAKLKSVANIIDSIYKLLNTRVVLASVVIWTTDPYEVSTNPSRALGQFQKWRETDLVTAFSHDNAQLITGKSFEGSTVGMAALSTMCSRDQSCGVSQEHGNMDNDVASTIAHEMGHNLGLSHDSDKCDCLANPNVGCVMAASSGGTPPLLWSSCSREVYMSNLQRGLGACMFNYPKVIFDGPKCQNGFIEEGEECDCGTVEECDNPCCVPETCKLHVNATCAFGECCEDCQLKEAGHMCRSMMNDCDLPEYCNGYQEECPGNVYRQNGERCRHTVSDLTSCFNGMCMSYDDQCASIWGDGATVAHPKCWRYNSQQQASAFGNCGVDQNGEYIRCSREHQKCGKLLCEGGRNFPVLSSLASASQGYIFDEDGVKRLCKSASLDQGNDIPDPGYVAEGSPCDSKMICYEYKCVNHSYAGISGCPQNCNGNGICNSESHCHCNKNWAWPTCNTPGHGGSQDSGPTVEIIPGIPTTVMVVTPLSPTPSGLPGTGVSSVPPTNTSSTPVGPAPTAGNVVMMVVLGFLLLAAIIALVLFIFWKRDAIRKKLSCKRMKVASPKHSPPSLPTTTPISLVIEHPAHISHSVVDPPPYDSHHYANMQSDDIKPVRPAPTAPPTSLPTGKPANRRSKSRWSNGSIKIPLSPTSHQVRYQKMDDPIMYDEPPNVAFVDPSIPRPSDVDRVSQDRHHVEHPVPSSTYDDRSPSENVQFRLPSAPVTKPSHAAPRPPVKPLNTTEPSVIPAADDQKPQKPFGQAALKPTGFAGLKPPSQQTNKPDSKLPSPVVLKPVGRVEPQPVGPSVLKPAPPSKPPVQTAPKPPGPGALRPSGQAALKPPTPVKPSNQDTASVLPALKPAPAARKPVLPSKPSVPLKPPTAVAPNPRPALRPVGLSSHQDRNLNNSASTESPSEEVDEAIAKLGLRSSFRGGVKPQLPPPPPNKGKPSPPPKPIDV